MLHVIIQLLTLCCAHSINTHQNSRHSTLGLKLLKVEGHTRGTFFKEESKVIGYILVYIYIHTLAWITVENTGSLTVLELSCLCHTLKRCLVYLSEICEWQKGGRKNASLHLIVQQYIPLMCLKTKSLLEMSVQKI